MICVGAGIALYGAAYFIVHDIIIHQDLSCLRGVITLMSG
jgi:hypothetical protein